ncbi:MAG: polysaccharide biosynthesis/export family protein [Planctomycetales bacterium]
MCASNGCVALNGVPPTRVPRELLGRPREDMLKTSMTRLRQDKPKNYLLDVGDTLGIYIENVLGRDDQEVPVNNPKEDNRPPSLGYPIPVEDSGAIKLPYVDAIIVKGLTVEQATAKIRQAFLVDKKILPEGRERIIVSLLRPRTHSVLVVRQELDSATYNRIQNRTTNRDFASEGRSGGGFIIELPAYENDILHALNQTGGMPGDSSKNEVIIYRGMFKDAEQRDSVLAAIHRGADPCSLRPQDPADKNITRIPLSYYPDQPPQFTQDEVILNDGDIMMIEARSTEVFYTGGILQGQEIMIPRDYDLDVLGALSIAGAQVGGVGTGIGNLGRGGQLGSIRTTNIGVPPSVCYVIRKTPGGGQVPIRVNIKKTLVDPNERILIQPGDLVLLQFTPGEELANAFLGVFQLVYTGSFASIHTF